ncbi:MAG: PHP domain-containing protein, partial [Promethearchaeota archaeon]
QQLSTDLSPNEFLFDFHVHTSTSDGSLSPRDRVEWYIDQGIHGAAFSDHHHPYGSQIAQEYVDRKGLDFTILLSQEFTDDYEDIHLNIYGIDIPLTPVNYTTGSYSPNTMTCEETIKWVKTQGGYVTVNHYRGGGGYPFTYEQLRDWGVDGFEIINGDDLRAPEIREFCLANNLICMAGTDEHGNQELTTIVKLYLPDPSNKSLDAIFSSLRNNTHETILITQYPERVSLSSDFIESFINYQLGLTWGQSISWFIWSVLIYSFMLYFFEKMVLNRGTSEKETLNRETAK